MCESKRFPERSRLYRWVAIPARTIAEAVITTLIFGGAILAVVGVLMFLLSLIVKVL